MHIEASVQDFVIDRSGQDAMERVSSLLSWARIKISFWSISFLHLLAYIS